MSSDTLNQPAPKSKHPGGRPRKGTLEWRGKSWYGRLTVNVDGEAIRKWVDLGTAHRTVARRKLARMVAGELPVEQARQDETYADLAARVQKDRRAQGIRDVRTEELRERIHILPHLGPLAVTSIKPSHVRTLLEDAQAKGKSHGTLRHIYRIVSGRLAVAWREELIPENPASRVKVPTGKVDRRERAVLTDQELGLYLAWQHPDEHRQSAVRERQTMACVARCFGGLRTGDLHSLRWESFETDGGRFSHGWAPRRKTARPQLLEVPAMLRPILGDWWQRAGRPTSGLVFPALLGKHAGKGEKVGVSHAEAMRRDLRRAFGIEVPKSEERKRGEKTVTVHTWTQAREPTPRERELLEGTDTVRPVDFHSWRRAFNQALADAGTNAQQAQALAGHSSLEAHQRYLTNTAKMRRMPLAALPAIRVLPLLVAKLPSPANESSLFTARPAGLEPATSGLERHRTSTAPSRTRQIKRRPAHQLTRFARLSHPKTRGWATNLAPLWTSKRATSKPHWQEA
jgi:integrase